MLGYREWELVSKHYAVSYTKTMYKDRITGRFMAVMDYYV